MLRSSSNRQDDRIHGWGGEFQWRDSCSARIPRDFLGSGASLVQTRGGDSGAEGAHRNRFSVFGSFFAHFRAFSSVLDEVGRFWANTGSIKKTWYSTGSLSERGFLGIPTCPARNPPSQIHGHPGDRTSISCHSAQHKRFVWDRG